MIRKYPAGPLRIIATYPEAIERNTERRRLYAGVFVVYENDRIITRGIRIAIHGESSTHYEPHNRNRFLPTAGIQTTAALDVDDGVPDSGAGPQEPTGGAPAAAVIPIRPAKRAVKTQEAAP